MLELIMSQTERIVYIFKEISANGYFRIEDISNKFEVGERTVKRDIEYIRDRLDIKLYWNKDNRSYGVYQKPKLEENSTEKLIVAKAIYQKVEKSYEIPKLFGEGIKNFLNSGISSDFKDLSDRVIFLSNVSIVCDFNLFSEILKAIKEGNSLSFDCDKEQNLIVTPYIIININYDWSLFGFDNEQRRMKLFSLSKITNFKINIYGLVN